MPLNINPPSGNGNSRTTRSGGKALRMDNSSCSDPDTVVIDGPVDATITNTCDNPVPIAACEPLDVNIVSTDVPAYHYEKTGYICNPETNTWVCELLSWIDGVQQDPVVIDSGISCEQDPPTDVELKEIRTCVDGFEQVQVCQITFIGGVAQEPVLIGDPIATGIACNVVPKSHACMKDKFVEGGLDNTFTNFAHTNQIYTVTFDNGDVDTFAVPSATGWTDQVNQISAGLDGIMPWAQTVESFCNIAGGCGGLPAPFVELNKMVARYTGFRVCPGDKVPVSVTYISDQVKEPKELVIQYVETDTIYIDVCIDCETGEKTFTVDGEPYVPVCAIPCEEEFPAVPLSKCSSDTIAGNWCDVDIDVYEDPENTDDPLIQSDIIILVTYCDGLPPELNYFTADADGGLIEYPVVGEIRNCDNYDEAPEAEPVCRPKGSYTGKTFCYEKKSKFRLVEKQFEGAARTVDISAEFGLPVGSIIATNDAAIFTGGNSDILAAGANDPVTFTTSGTQPVCIKVLHGGAIPTDGASDGMISNDGVPYTFTGNITGDGTVSQSGNVYLVTAGTDNVQGAINWTSQGPATSATATTTNGNPANSVRFFVATFDCSTAEQWVSDCGEIEQWWDGNVQVDISGLTESDCCKEETNQIIPGAPIDICIEVERNCQAISSAGGGQASDWNDPLGTFEFFMNEEFGGVEVEVATDASMATMTTAELERLFREGIKQSAGCEDIIITDVVYEQIINGEDNDYTFSMTICPFGPDECLKQTGWRGFIDMQTNSELVVKTFTENATLQNFCNSDGSIAFTKVVDSQGNILTDYTIVECPEEEAADPFAPFKTVCPDPSIIPDANYDGAMPITTGRPLNTVPWELIDNRDPNNQVVVVSGATFQEFSTNLATAGYTEFIEGEIHYICPCPPGYDGPTAPDGAYFTTADGQTVTKGGCVALTELNSAPEKPAAGEEQCALRTLGCLDQQILDELKALNSSPIETIQSREVCLDIGGGTVLNAYAILCVSKSGTELVRYEDGFGNEVTGTPVNCTCDAVDIPEINLNVEGIFDGTGNRQVYVNGIYNVAVGDNVKFYDPAGVLQGEASVISSSINSPATGQTTIRTSFTAVQPGWSIGLSAEV